MPVSRMTLPRTLVVVLAFLLGMAAPPPAAHAAPAENPEVFTVHNVEVDVTAGTAAAARDRAIHQAQREAFGRLFARLTLQADAGRLPVLGDDGIDRLVDAFEVEDERASAVRYVGRFTIRFRPQAVRELMLSNGIRYAEVPSKPVLILPVDQTTGSPVLWQQETVWRQVWEQLEPPTGLVPILVPYGELQDVSDIGAEQALAGDQDALRRIADRYGAGAVAVAQAGLDGTLAPPTATTADPGQPVAGPPAAPDTALTPQEQTSREEIPDRPRGLAALVTLHRFDGAAPEVFFIEMPAPPAPPPEPGVPPPDGAAQPPVAAAEGAAPATPADGLPPGVADLMPRAVAKIVAHLEQSWIAANLLETGRQSRLTAGVSFSGPEEWAATRRRLAAVPIVTGVRLVSLSRSGAVIDITYLGDPARLRTALAQQDLVLTESDAAPASAGPEAGAAAAGAEPRWRVTPRGPSPAVDPAQPQNAQPATP